MTIEKELHSIEKKVKKIDRFLCCLDTASVKYISTFDEHPDPGVEGIIYITLDTNEGWFVSNGVWYHLTDDELNQRLSILENNVYKITYYEIVSGTSGTLTIPTGATINAGEFGTSGNSILSKITGSNKVTFESPKDSSNNIVTANLALNGSWVTSGVYTDTSVAIIYSINISALDYQNLNNFYILGSEYNLITIYSPLTTKGDLHTFSTIDAKLPVGINGQVLSSDSTTTTGLKWVTAGGTVTSVAALTLGTTGTDLSSTVATSTTTPVITLNVPTASATNRGVLSTTDWSAFNGKQNALSGTGIVKSTSGTISYLTDNSTNWNTAYTNRITSLTTTGSSGSATLISNTLNIPTYTLSGLGGQPALSGTGFVKISGTTISYDNSTYLTANQAITVTATGEATGTSSASGTAPSIALTLTNSAVIGKVLTGLSITGGSITSSDSILSAFGKLQNQVTGLVGGVSYQGTWNASTNSPLLTSSSGTKGYYYVVATPGSTNLDGITDWKLGDWVIFNGTTWNKVDNTDAVVSVNGYTGAVSLTTLDVTENTNLYFTPTRAQNAITLTTTGSSGASTYTTGTLNIPTYTLSGLGGQPLSTNLTSLSGLTYASTSFVKMTASGTFALDTNTYLTSAVTSIATAGLISGGTITSTGTITTSMSTNKLVGRSTAGTGVMEEITVGSGLSLSGGTLSASTVSGTIPHSTASGTDTYTVTIAGVSAYTDGDAYLIQFTNGNTTTSTLNINSIGAISLYRNNDGELIGGDIASNGEMLCIYDSTITGFRLIGTSPNTLLSYITNADSVSITKGQPVYAFGGTGDRMTVKLAYNTSDATSAQTVGLVLSSSIAAGQKGLILMQGLLDGLGILPTSTFADGNPIYLGATAGSITNVKPSAPNHLVYLGVVTTASNGSAGRMYVRVQNGYELDEIHDVQVGSYGTKDVLYRDTTTNLWKNASISSVLGYTPQAALSGSGLVKSTSGTISYITDNSTNWDSAYTNRITSLTTTGSSGSATLSSNTLNIPTYTLAGLGGQASSTNLTSLAGLTYTSSAYVKMTAAGTFTLDTTAISGNLIVGTTAITSGTAGRILFENSSNTLGESADLFWDATNTRLGIGTSSPLKTVDIDRNVNSTVAIKITNANAGAAAETGYQLTDGTGFIGLAGFNKGGGYGVYTAGGGGIYATSTDFYIGVDSPNRILFGTNYGIPLRMEISATGNVGIGHGLSDTISARFQVRATTEQVRISYDVSNYYSTTVGSTGGVIFDAVGSGASFGFSDPITTGVWNGTAISDTYISSATTWNAKQGAITLTTTGTSGAATLVGNTLNIPQYSGGGGGGTGITWTATTTDATMAVDNGYIANKATLLTMTLPTTAAVGKVVRIAGQGVGGWKIAQNASGKIYFGNSPTTTGTGGYLSSVNQYDAVELVCITANNEWVVASSQGNITIV